MLQDLPNLEELHLNQKISDRSDEISSMLGTMTNVLKKLAGKKTWPRLPRIDLPYLTTMMADFKTFIRPRPGTLQTLIIHSEFVCGPKDTRTEAAKILPPILGQD